MLKIEHLERELVMQSAKNNDKNKIIAFHQQRFFFFFQLLSWAHH